MKEHFLDSGKKLKENRFHSLTCLCFFDALLCILDNRDFHCSVSSPQTLPDFSMENGDDEYRQSVLDHQCER